MTKSSYILLIGIAIMIVIGAAVWNSTGGNGANALPTNDQVATPIATVSSTIGTTTSTIAESSTTTSTESSGAPVGTY